MPLGKSFPRPKTVSPIVKAAQYARKSTGDQRCSIENQMDIIAAYAACHGMQIVRSYIDDGKSGLKLTGRRALTRLIDDVSSGRAEFNVVLVADVSRWGQFRNSDESAHYEYLCRKAGVKIQYCGEQFSNDGTMLATLLKSLKRVMAAEYSRDLSAKIFQSQMRLARLGFRQGAVPGYGYRRLLIDEEGVPRMILKERQLKRVQTDRVILIPGPEEEIQIVRLIFRLYVEKDYDCQRIARYLNERGLANSRGNKWRNGNIFEILSNEKYIGNLVYNRSSLKLGAKRTSNHPDTWVRVEGVFEPLVDRDIFERAQLRVKFSSRRTTNELLDHLTCTLCVNGYLTPDLIDSFGGGPCSTTYIERFGTLIEAYGRIGYRAQHWRRRKLVGDHAFNRALSARTNSPSRPTQ